MRKRILSLNMFKLIVINFTLNPSFLKRTRLSICPSTFGKTTSEWDDRAFVRRREIDGCTRYPVFHNCFSIALKVRNLSCTRFYCRARWRNHTVVHYGCAYIWLAASRCANRPDLKLRHLAIEVTKLIGMQSLGEQTPLIVPISLLLLW